MSEIFFDGAETALVTFIENGFLQTMFSKSGGGTLDKATLLMTTFGDGANLKYFSRVVIPICDIRTIDIYQNTLNHTLCTE
ncbi:hypothetical protein RhiirA4_482052 [Rhizophagus irregularis]|uniref:Uncharacterized protein n=1 Tax=Rhizophagus irregularis TaxID=588596 RepID=A0A2I1HKI0_9GLOM|nr:hypothetical protein RhiirA4_482052 [Rhizophagus irregularis]